MKKVLCNGKCHECEIEPDYQESCAIFTTQRRTFELSDKLNRLEKMLDNYLQNQSNPKVATAALLETSDNFDSKIDE